MLAPDARAILLDLLRPPPGYRLDAAVATTFTLDLTAALTAPLAFASFAMNDAADPVAVMEGIRGVAGKVDVFCQAGHITVPRQASDLVAFLEPMVHEVRQPKPGHVFHPKLWMLRFASNGDPRHRLVVPTRNLTTDSSWDAVLCLEGRPGKRPRRNNRPLVTLLRALPAMVTRPLPPERRERIDGLAEEVRSIEWEHPEDVRQITFHVFGVKGSKPAIDLDGYRHLVISPFLTDKGVRRITDVARGPVAVVSRAEELEKLDPGLLERLDAHVLSSLAGLEVLDEVEGAHGIRGGLHAKVYVLERHGGARFFVGSLNTTGAGFAGNVEILVELAGKQRTMGVDSFLGDDAPFAALLERYDALGGQDETPAELAKRELDGWLRSAAEHSFALRVRPAGAVWELSLHVDAGIDPPAGGRAAIEVLGRQGNAAELPLEPAGPSFGPMPLADVSAFLVIHAWLPHETGEVHGSTVVRAALIDDPPSRLDEILARQVDTPDKFLRFVLVLLSLAGEETATEWMKGAGSDGTRSGFATSGVLELVVRALADQPRAIDDLGRLVDRLRKTEAGRAVLPAGFDAFWREVSTARQSLRAAAR